MLTVVAGEVLADRIGAEPARVLALHGWARTGADFSRVLDGTDGLAVHLPGFGHTPAPPEPWGSAEYAAHLIRAIDDSRVERGPYVVVGHSFGGRVAVRLAAQRPDLVSALVLTGVPLIRSTPAPRPRLALRVAKKLNAARILPGSVVDRLRRSGGSADYNAAQGVMRGVLVRVVGEDYREDLARVAAPVHMVWGELDDAAPPAGARMAAGLLADARLDVVPGAGHLIEGDLERALRERLTEVLASTGGSGAVGGSPGANSAPDGPAR